MADNMELFKQFQDNPSFKNIDQTDTFATTTELTLTPVKSLEIKANFTYSFNQNRSTNRSVNTSYSQYPGELVEMVSGRSENKLTESYQTHHYYASNIYATWTQTFAQDYHLKLMGGFNWETKHLKDNSALGYYLMSDTLYDLALLGTDADGNKRMEVTGGQNAGQSGENRIIVNGNMIIISWPGGMAHVFRRDSV